MCNEAIRVVCVMSDVITHSDKLWPLQDEGLKVEGNPRTGTIISSLFWLMMMLWRSSLATMTLNNGHFPSTYSVVLSDESLLTYGNQEHQCSLHSPLLALSVPTRWYSNFMQKPQELLCKTEQKGTFTRLPIYTSMSDIPISVAQYWIRYKAQQQLLEHTVA